MVKNNISKEIFRFILIALIIATLIFIFSNSLKSKEVSSLDSQKVGGIVSLIFPPDTPLGAFIAENIRKIAHFLEFGLLGFFTALYVSFYTRRRLLFGFMSLSFGLFAGLVDESLQYISLRGPSILDVWIDFGGFSAFALATYLLLTLIAFLVYRGEIKREEKNNG